MRPFLKQAIFFVFVFFGLFLLFSKITRADWGIDTTPPFSVVCVPHQTYDNNNNQTGSCDFPTNGPPPTAPAGTYTFVCDETKTGNSGCYSMDIDIRFYTNSSLQTPDTNNEIQKTICTDGSVVAYQNSSLCPQSGFNQTIEYQQPIDDLPTYPYVTITYNVTDGVGNTNSSSLSYGATGCSTASNSPNPCGILLTPQFFTVSGYVFNDTNEDGCFENGQNASCPLAPGEPVESGYGTGLTVHLDNTSGGTSLTAQTQTDGSFSFTNIVAGDQNYNLTLDASLPIGYRYTSSPIPIPINRITADKSNQNIGITNQTSWYQCLGADCRDDNGVVDGVPVGQFATVQSTQSTTPGIFFTGNKDADFLPGSVSTKGWLVGGSNIGIGETFTPPNGNIRTSYEYFLTSAKDNGITTDNGKLLDMTTLCADFSNCTLPATVPEGIYLANGDVHLNAYHFSTQNKNYIFLINGSLYLQGNTVGVAIEVDPTNTVTFAAAQDIDVTTGVGGAPNDTTTHIQGFYSADRNVILDSPNDTPCANNTPDKRINFAGVVVANALQSGGKLINKRDLCSFDSQYPTYTFTERPDFFIYSPSLIKHKNAVYEEVSQ